MTSPEVFDVDVDNDSYTVGVYNGSSNDTFNSSVSLSDSPINPMGLAGIVATSIILGVMTLTTIVGKKIPQSMMKGEREKGRKGEREKGRKGEREKGRLDREIERWRDREIEISECVFNDDCAYFEF